jgi:membrane protein
MSSGKRNSRTKKAKGEPSAWNLRSLSIWQLARGLVRGFVDNELLTRAAALSFYFIFALFPMALSLLALLGFVAQNSDFRAGLIARFGKLMPPSAFALVTNTIHEISTHSSGWKLIFGFVVALWSGSGGISCIMDSLNRSYRVRESRQFWKLKLLAIGLTAAISALTFVALLIVLYGGNVPDWLGADAGVSRFLATFWGFAEWPIVLLFVLLSLALIYYAGPDIRRPWHWVTPGSVVGVLVWVVASLLFRMYVRYFSSYSRSYGSLGAVMVLLLWLYITGLAILLGGEINAEIEFAQQAKPSESQ